MALHTDLTGTDLHEPKGIAAAAINKVYISNGAGSGDWAKIAASQLDATVKGVGTYKQVSRIADISTADFILIPITASCTLNNVTVILKNAITVANSIVTVVNSTGPATIGTITITQAGSAEGSTFTLTASSNNTFVAGAYIKISTDGGSTTTCEAYVLTDWTLT